MSVITRPAYVQARCAVRSPTPERLFMRQLPGFAAFIGKSLVVAALLWLLLAAPGFWAG